MSMWPFKKKKIETKNERANIKSWEYESYKYWTPELIEWLAKEKDALKLACASCLVNTHKWPDWLPGKPEKHDTPEANTGALLHFIVSVHKQAQAKAEVLQPGLTQTVWMTQYYRNYKPE